MATKQIYIFNTSGLLLTTMMGTTATLNANVSEEDIVVYFEGNPQKHIYLKDGEITPLKENPTSLRDLTLSNIPIPATITINTETYEIEDSEIELEFDQVGVYTIRVESFPYLPKEFQIEINE